MRKLISGTEEGMFPQNGQPQLFPQSGQPQLFLENEQPTNCFHKMELLNCFHWGGVGYFLQYVTPFSAKFYYVFILSAQTIPIPATTGTEQLVQRCKCTADGLGKLEISLDCLFPTTQSASVYTNGSHWGRTVQILYRPYS